MYRTIENGKTRLTHIPKEKLPLGELPSATGALRASIPAGKRMDVGRCAAPCGCGMGCTDRIGTARQL